MTPYISGKNVTLSGDNRINMEQTTCNCFARVCGKFDSTFFTFKWFGKSDSMLLQAFLKKDFDRVIRAKHN